MNSIPMYLFDVPGELGRAPDSLVCHPEERNLVDQSIYDLYPVQPPLWYPRANFVSNIAFPAAKPTQQQPVSRELAIFQDIPPLGQFDNDQQRSGGIRWTQHLEDTLSLLRAINQKKWASTSMLCAYDRIMGRGLEEQVAFLPSNFVVRGYNDIQFFFKNDTTDEGCLPNGYELCPCSMTDVLRDMDALNASLYGRRQWAARVNFQTWSASKNAWIDQHWATLLFDRRHGVLYYWDSTTEHRDQRSKAAGLIWRVFLARLRLPYTFQVASMGIRKMPGSWACGYISSFSLHLAIRGLYGQTLSAALSRGRRFQNVDVDNTRNPTPMDSLPFDSEIRLVPWTALGQTVTNAFKTVTAVISGCCAHELSLTQPTTENVQNGFPNLTADIAHWLESTQVPDTPGTTHAWFAGVTPTRLPGHQPIVMPDNKPLLRVCPSSNHWRIVPFGPAWTRSKPLRLDKLVDESVLQVWRSRLAASGSTRTQVLNLPPILGPLQPTLNGSQANPISLC